MQRNLSLVTPHSAFCIVHYALCIAALALTATAAIPTTLEKNTDYVVNCETGAAPTKIFVENSSLTLDNRSWVDFKDSRSDSQTNFFLHVTGGSVATNFNNFLKITNGGRIVVDGGSTLRLQSANYYMAAAGAKGVSMSVTNSSLFTGGNLVLNSFSNTLTLCNSRFSGSQTLQISGLGNRFVVSGDCGTTPISLAVFTGTNNWVVLEDGARLASTTTAKLQNGSAGPCGYHIGRNAFLFCGYSGLSAGNAGTSNGWVVVEEGGEFSVSNGDGDTCGLAGYDTRWILNNGTYSCSNNMVRVGNYSKHRGTRLELNGDDANFFAMNLRIGNTGNTTNLTIALNPGAGAYGDRAPLWSKRAVTFDGACVFEIDLRAPLRARAANEILRLPVVQAAVDVSGSAFTLSTENLAKLNEQLVTQPPGGRLELDGKVLYCVMKRKATTVLAVR